MGQSLNWMEKVRLIRSEYNDAIRVETDDYGNVENIERYPKVGDTLTDMHDKSA